MAERGPKEMSAIKQAPPTMMPGVRQVAMRIGAGVAVISVSSYAQCPKPGVDRGSPAATKANLADASNRSLACFSIVEGLDAMP
jgi:hypothetical protein